MKAIFRNIYRFIKYKEHRKRVLREVSIIPLQNKEWNKKMASKTIKKLIVFVVPGTDRITGKETISGGVISIYSICEETKKIFCNTEQTEVIICTLNDDDLLLRYTQFENNETIFRFNQIVKNLKHIEELIIHLPDFITIDFNNSLTKKDLNYFKTIPFVHFNIMNQNIKLMPLPNEIAPLKSIAQLVTITTAHQQYSTQYYRDYYNVPLHKLSVWISPEQYCFKQKNDKENLLIYSPDNHPEKEKIINKLSEIKGLKLQMIKGLTYTQYKEVISKAKWAVTFGEGLDGYFLEPVFSGAVSFAVYNDDFFTTAFKELKTVYGSYQLMAENIVADIEKLDNDEVAYKQLQATLFKPLANLYSSKEYQNNIAKFYKHDFTFK